MPLQQEHLMWAVPPLRVPVEPDLDLQNPLSDWLDWCEQNPLPPPPEEQPPPPDEPLLRPQWSADECQGDLHRLSQQRAAVAAALSQQSFAAVCEALPVLREYAAALQEFERAGFLLPLLTVDAEEEGGGADTAGDAAADPLAAAAAAAAQESAGPVSPLAFRWTTQAAKDAVVPTSNSSSNGNSDDDQEQQNGDTSDVGDNMTTLCDSYGNLAWERANVVWNIVACEAYQATRKKLTTKQGWVQVGEAFSKASAGFKQLRHELYPAAIEAEAAAAAAADPNNSAGPGAPTPPVTIRSPPFSGLALNHAVLLLWQAVLLAQAQLAAYQVFCKAPRSRHFMKAKLAAATGHLFQTAEDFLAAELRPHADSLPPHTAGRLSLLLPGATGSLKDPVVQKRLQQQEEYVRAWGMWMSCLMEYHQAAHCEENSEWGAQLARLQTGIRFGNLCQDYCASSGCQLGPEKEDNNETSATTATTDMTMNQVLQELRTRHGECEQSHPGVTVPSHDDLPDIAMQLSVKADPDLTKILPAVSQPFFTSVMDNMARYYVQQFRAEMEQVVQDTAAAGDEKTETARKALALVNLPHSLTAYRQELQGGGIPADLWERIAAMQGRDDALRRELWDLRDLAESARRLYEQIDKLLEEDILQDKLFREANTSFEGHNVPEIQTTFRQALANYDRLMAAAEESDALLLQRCEMLENDPKFSLLKFQKSQLDILLPARGGADAEEIDVSSLSKHLVDLSALFNDRESLLHTLREQVRRYNIGAQLTAVEQETEEDREAEYQRIVQTSKLYFDEIIQKMRESIELQDALLDVILRENEDFMRARIAANRRGSSSSENFIVKIEDALEELDQFSEHLREGRAFYDVIIPKLEKLREQVGTVSARLTMERCDFEDRLRQSHQEAEDRRLADQISSEVGAGGGGGEGGSRSSHALPPGNPGVESISHGEPHVRVDDGKVAQLVNMGFDPERAVEALRKHDNNEDRALNELLMG